MGGSSNANRQFVWGQRFIDDLVERDRDTTESGMLNERLYGVQDANGNLTTIMDSSGTVQERYSYSAYCLPTFMTPTFGNRGNSTFDWERLIAGYYWDSESGFYQVRNRCLAPNLGVWIQRDPIGLSSGINLYQYVSSSPTNNSDPSGLDAITGGALAACFFGGIGCAAIALVLLIVLAVLITLLAGFLLLIQFVDWVRAREREVECGRRPVQCSIIPRGVCPPGCNQPFHAQAPTFNECRRAAFALCVAAGCHTPGGQPFNCNCGHAH